MPELRLVMFPHPLGEYAVSCKRSVNAVGGIPCGWNTGAHRRRLLLCSGDYVDEVDKKQSGEISFWSEWEANSRAFRLQPLVNRPLHATFVHCPQVPAKAPPGKDGKCTANTDPCVFGDTFKYALCHQRLGRRNSPTKMQGLAPGSLILFGGCTKNSFYLDTVFVVASAVQYKGPDKKVPQMVSCDPVYRTLTLNQTSGALTFYRGVTFDQRESFKGLYSFTPGCLADTSDSQSLTECQRARCKLDLDSLNRKVKEDPKFFNPRCIQNFKSVTVDEKTIRAVWAEVLGQVRQNFVPAVHFDYPQRVSNL